ncbi:MAG TPA: exo-alpha-sialidase, partial [Pirellulaceae bacterium]|nr:exo-alpha-sialidase [Pirellulaceae bacterium]
MSSIRVLVGTKKGGFVLSSDAGRKKWSVSGPFFNGWEVYHLKGSPVNPDRIYCSQTSGWF